MFKGIPTTTVARMLVDLSATHTEYQVAYVINRAACEHRFDLDGDAAGPGAREGTPGNGRARPRHRPLPRRQRRAPGATSRTGSSSWSGGFPVPLVNMEHLGYEVDFRWPDQRLVVEVDGNHTRPRDKRNDAARDRVLRDAGYTVVRFTGPELPSAPARLTPYF